MNEQQSPLQATPASPALPSQLRFAITYILGLAFLALILGHWPWAIGLWLACLPLATIAEIGEAHHLGLSAWNGIVVAPLCPFSVILLWRWAGRLPTSDATTML